MMDTRMRRWRTWLYCHRDHSNSVRRQSTAGLRCTMKGGKRVKHLLERVCVCQPSSRTNVIVLGVRLTVLTEYPHRDSNIRVTVCLILKATTSSNSPWLVHGAPFIATVGQLGEPLSVNIKWNGHEVKVTVMDSVIGVASSRSTGHDNCSI